MNDVAIPPGTIRQLVFSGSRIYPGTSRTVTVFIPAQYDGSRPACVYVRQDGYDAKEKPLLEQLIAAGDMPVTIAVFVQPGELPAPMPGTLPRRNRCFEYDSLGDGYARFILDEILPAVSREFTLRLSDSGNDRCIAGCSSGGIAAFNAAWERPDAFTRVYANSGSFVAFRGGNMFPTLVRKHEPKPIRAYLTTGSDDMVNCAGDWHLVDQEMDRALSFSGYDHRFVVLDGGHGAGWHVCFPEAMRYLWRSWPEPVLAGSGAPRVRDILVPDAGWEPVLRGPALACPVADASGTVHIIDGGSLRRIRGDGTHDVSVGDHGGADGLAVGAQGEIYSVSASSGRITRYDAAGRSEVCCSGVPGTSILAGPQGELYLSGPAGVWLVRDGRAVLVDSGLKRASGIACRPDRWLLAVADGASKWLYSYRIAADGGLVDKQRFFWLHVGDGDDDAGTEAVCYAAEGQLFAATRIGVQVCADDGPAQVILPLPDRSPVRGVCLGGAAGDQLYALGAGTLWRRRVQQHAHGAWSAWTAVLRTPL